jgi:hypothetical protein
MGIYWVFFDLKGQDGGEMRLQQTSPTQDSAIKAAKDRAFKMHNGWVYRKTQACR